MRSLFRFVLLIGVSASAWAQWQVLDAHTTADFRGVHYVGDGVAWVSGTNGTVLRTGDMGKTWTHCAVPPGAEKLDFRGVQAFDAKTAIVMSSGAGDQSRLYKTSDGCATWKLVFTNPDKDGFFDAIAFDFRTSDYVRFGFLVGDPVGGRFSEFFTRDYGDTWERIGPKDWVDALGPANEGEALFAASNSSLQIVRGGPVIVTGGSTSRMREVELQTKHDPLIGFRFIGGTIPVQHDVSAGAFSFAMKPGPDSVADKDRRKFVEKFTHSGDLLIAVGGDYKKPEAASGNCALSEDGGLSWHVCKTSPHGYRSAVVYDEGANAWITVGPNGTDVSFDDGLSWRAATPSAGDAPDADRNWNALSLPFVVGPHGRIGLLRESALVGLSDAKNDARTRGTRR